MTKFDTERFSAALAVEDDMPPWYRPDEDQVLDLVADVIGGCRQDGLDPSETAEEVLNALRDHRTEIGGDWR